MNMKTVIYNLKINQDKSPFSYDKRRAFELLNSNRFDFKKKDMNRIKQSYHDQL